MQGLAAAKESHSEGAVPEYVLNSTSGCLHLVDKGRCRSLCRWAFGLPGAIRSWQVPSATRWQCEKCGAEGEICFAIPFSGACGIDVSSIRTGHRMRPS